MEQAEDYSVDQPEVLSGRWISFSQHDFMFAGFLLPIIIVSTAAIGLGGFALSLLFSLFWLHRWQYGRTYWIFGEALYSAWIDKIKKGVVWSKDKKTRKPPVPYVVNGVGDIGVVNTPSLYTDSIICMGDGSDIASLEIALQAYRNKDFASAIRKIASPFNLSVRLSFGFRRRPKDISIDDTYSALNRHDQVILPEALLRPQEEWTARDHAWYQLFKLNNARRLEVGGFDVQMFAVITIERSSKLQRAVQKEEGVNETDVYQIPIIQMAQAAIANFTNCNVVRPRILNLNQAERFMRGAWDVDTLPRYYAEETQRRAEHPEPQPSGHHWPQEEMLAKHDFSVADTTGHAVFSVTETPKKAMPDLMRQLYTSNVPYVSVSLVGETVKSRSEYVLLNGLIALTDAIREGFGFVHQGRASQNRREERTRRQAEVFDSRLTMHYNILIDCAHGDPDELERGSDTILSEVQALNMAAKRVKGSCRQYKAMWSATTCISIL